MPCKSPVRVAAPVPPFATVSAVVRARVLAVSVVPSKVRLDESVKAPAVVAYGTRPLVSAETVRLVVEAVPETVMAVEEA